MASSQPSLMTPEGRSSDRVSRSPGDMTLDSQWMTVLNLNFADLWSRIQTAWCFNVWAIAPICSWSLRRPDRVFYHVESMWEVHTGQLFTPISSKWLGKILWKNWGIVFCFSWKRRTNISQSLARLLWKDFPCWCWSMSCKRTAGRVDLSVKRSRNKMK